MSARVGRRRPLLLDPDFGRYWFGALFSASGMWLWRITGPVIMYQLTGSPWMLGVLSLAQYGPILLLSFVGGVLADRFPRRLLITACHLVIASVFGVLAVLASAGQLNAGILLVAAVVEGATFALAKPALQALVTELVPSETVPRAVAVNTAHFSIAQLVGPGLATVALITGSQVVPLALAAVFYLPISVIVFGLRPKYEHRAADGERESNLLRSAGRVLRTPNVARLLIAIACGSVALEGSVRVLAPRFVTEVLGSTESRAGLIISAQALGSVVAVVVVSRAERTGRTASMAVSSAVLMAGAIALYSVAPSLLWALGFASLVGAMQTSSFSIATGAIHKSTPPGMRGRVMGFHALALLGFRPVGGLMAGFLATQVSTRAASASFVVFALAAAAILATLRPRAPIEPTIAVEV